MNTVRFETDEDDIERYQGKKNLNCPVPIRFRLIRKFLRDNPNSTLYKLEQAKLWGDTAKYKKDVQAAVRQGVESGLYINAAEIDPIDGSLIGGKNLYCINPEINTAELYEATIEKCTSDAMTKIKSAEKKEHPELIPGCEMHPGMWDHSRKICWRCAQEERKRDYNNG